MKTLIVTNKFVNSMIFYLCIMCPITLDCTVTSFTLALVFPSRCEYDAIAFLHARRDGNHA